MSFLLRVGRGGGNRQQHRGNKVSSIVEEEVSVNAKHTKAFPGKLKKEFTTRPTYTQQQQWTTKLGLNSGWLTFTRKWQYFLKEEKSIFVLRDAEIDEDIASASACHIEASWSLVYTYTLLMASWDISWLRWGLGQENLFPIQWKKVDTTWAYIDWQHILI